MRCALLGAAQWRGMMLDAHGGTVKVAFWNFGFDEGVL